MARVSCELNPSNLHSGYTRDAATGSPLSCGCTHGKGAVTLQFQSCSNSRSMRDRHAQPTSVAETGSLLTSLGVIRPVPLGDAERDGLPYGMWCTFTQTVKMANFWLAVNNRARNMLINLQIYLL